MKNYKKGIMLVSILVGGAEGLRNTFIMEGAEITIIDDWLEEHDNAALIRYENVTTIISKDEYRETRDEGK